MPIESQVTQTNYENIASVPSQISSLIMTNAASNQQNMNTLAGKTYARSFERMDHINADEGILNNSGQLAGAVALAQQLMKGAQTTLPESGK